MEKSYKITKLVICIILLCASLGTAIYFAIIPFVNVNTKYDLKSPDIIEVHVNGSYKNIEKGSDAFNEILELYNDSFIVSKSDLIFGNEVVNKQTLKSSNKMDKKKGTWLEFSYTTNQKLSLDYSNVEFTSIFIEITDTENMKATNAYLVDKSELTNGRTYKYTTHSKMHNLYEYLQDLV